MGTQELNITVKPRSLRGKKNRELKKEKHIPAVVYGPKQKNLSLSLDVRDAEKYYKKAYDNKIFTFQSEDKSLNGLKVIRKDVAIDKIKRGPIHIDFFALDMNAVVRVNLEVNFVGTPKGVKEEGGIMNITLRTVEVECLPDKIPSSLDVDVSELGLNEALHVSDLQISSDLKLITKKERTLCTIVSAEEEKVEEAPADGTLAADGTAAPADGAAAPAAEGAAPAADAKAEPAADQKKKD